MGSTAFLAPEIVSSPEIGAPPVINNFSIELANMLSINHADSCAGLPDGPDRHYIEDMSLGIEKA